MKLEAVLSRYFELDLNTAENEYLVLCPFHDDSNPSLSVNVEKKQFICHACGKKGPITALISKVSKYSEEIVAWELNHLVTPPKFNIDHFHERLLKNDELVDYLQEIRRWTPRVIEDLRIGWDGHRIVIPIFNMFGHLVNVRSYKPGAKDNEPKVLNFKGYGKARLFGIGALRDDAAQEDDFIFLCEGEPDRICCLSQGLRPVLTTTAGAGKFDTAWFSFFKDRKVVVAYDADQAGTRASHKIATGLSATAHSVRIINVDLLLNDPGKDLTDVFLQGTTADEIRRYVADTPVYEVKTDTEVTERDDNIYEVSLSESSEQRYYRKKVIMNVMVSGKTLAPYLIPKEVQVACHLPNLNMCKSCALCSTGGVRKIVFNYMSDYTLQLVETPTDSHLKIFKQVCGVPSKCQIVKGEVLEAQNVEEAKVIPDLDFSTDDSEYVIRQIYFIGHGIKANNGYRIRGLTIPHPKTQQVTYIVDEAKRLEDTISKFEVTEEIVNELKIFSIDGDTEQIS